MPDVSTIDPFHARPMQMEDWWRAYSIIRAVSSRISAEQWRQYVTDLLRRAEPIRDPRGACLLACPKDYFYGLFTYGVGRRLGLGRTLEVANFCVVPPTCRRTAADCLIRHAEAVARRADCTAMSISFLRDDMSKASLPSSLAVRVDDAFVTTSPGLLKRLRS